MEESPCRIAAAVHTNLSASLLEETRRNRLRSAATLDFSDSAVDFFSPGQNLKCFFQSSVSTDQISEPNQVPSASHQHRSGIATAGRSGGALVAVGMARADWQAGRGASPSTCRCFSFSALFSFWPLFVLPPWDFLLRAFLLHVGLSIVPSLHSKEKGGRRMETGESVSPSFIENTGRRDTEPSRAVERDRGQPFGTPPLHAARLPPNLREVRKRSSRRVWRQALCGRGDSGARAPVATPSRDAAVIFGRARPISKFAFL